MMANFKFGRNMRKTFYQSVTQATRKKKFRVLPTGVEPMPTFRTPVVRSTAELQETCESLGQITAIGSNVTNFPHTDRIFFRVVDK